MGDQELPITVQLLFHPAAQSSPPPPAVYLLNSGFPPSPLQAVYLLNSSFSGNSARVQGGALHALASILVASGCTFSDNAAGAGGGAIQAGSCVAGGGGALNIYGGSFVGNSATSGSGGAAWLSSCSASFNGTAIRANRAGGGGGALYADLAIADAGRPPGRFVVALDGCNASGNVAAAGDGGCLASSSVNLSITGGSWVGNSAVAGGGGAVALGGSGGSLTVTNVATMRQNQAVSGGAVRLGVDAWMCGCVCGGGRR